MLFPSAHQQTKKVIKKKENVICVADSLNSINFNNFDGFQFQNSFKISFDFNINNFKQLFIEIEIGSVEKT